MVSYLDMELVNFLSIFVNMSNKVSNVQFSDYAVLFVMLVKLLYMNGFKF